MARSYLKVSCSKMQNLLKLRGTGKINMAKYEIEFDIGSASENMRFSSETDNPITARNSYHRLADKGIVPTIYRNRERITVSSLTEECLKMSQL